MAIVCQLFSALGTPLLDSLPFFIPFQTAILLVLVSFGVLLLNPDKGMFSSFSVPLASEGILLFSLLFPLALGWIQSEAVLVGDLDPVASMKVIVIGCVILNGLVVWVYLRSKRRVSLFRELINCSKDSIEIVDGETGRVVDCNFATCRRLGYSYGEMTKSFVWESDDLLSKKAWVDYRSRVIENQGAKYQTIHCGKDGSRCPVEVSVTPVMLDRLYFVSTVQDVREKQKLRTLLRLDAELLSHTNDAVIALNMDWTIEYWNRSATALLGWTTKQRMGKNFLDQFSQQDREDVRKTLRSVLEGGKTVLDRQEQRPDGSQVWVEWSLYVKRTEANVPSGIILVMRNIEERRRFEARLRQSQKMEAIGTLAGGIAHDFNNIVAAIRGYTELSLRQCTNAGMRRDLGVVLQASHRAADLIKKILTFSHNQPDKISTVKLQDTVKEGIDLLRATLPSTIELEAVLDESLPPIAANEEQLIQVILNLGSNALHAMKGRCGKLSLSLSSVEVDEGRTGRPKSLVPGQYILLTVADTGDGMSDELQSRIFEPFFTTKASGEGTGLGLAMVHGIIKAHGGSIAVHSRPDEGTTFSMYFPPVAVEKPRDDVRTDSGLRGHGEHIMIVDDEEMLANLGKAMLEDLGYRATACQSPEEAIQLVRAGNQYDLIITDQTMPVMTGLELADKILEIKPSQQFIAITGYAKQSVKVFLEHDGVVGFLHKPISFDDLSRVVGNALADRVSELSA
ncbi:MAG: PAS domain S-box protein [Verrucomicrobiota bacterium]